MRSTRETSSWRWPRVSGEKSTITDYVVTDSLAANFDKALGLIKSAVETGSSRAAYLDGSFGSGKSHFMAVLYAILSGDADARGKKGLADVVAKHDPWMRGRKFLLVPYHLPDSQSLDAAILGGYVAHVAKAYPGRPLPDVYVDDQLIEDAKADRQRLGDEAFIAQLPASDEEAAEWGTPDWDSRSLDEAFSPAARRRGAPPAGRRPARRPVSGGTPGRSGPTRSPTSRWTRACRSSASTPRTSSASTRSSSCSTSSCSGWPATSAITTKVSIEAQKVSKLVESAELRAARPGRSASCPRQRDLRDLVRKAAAGNEVTSLFDTLKYWDGRFDRSALDRQQPPRDRARAAAQAEGRPRQGHARRRLRQVHHRPGRRPGTSCSTRTANKGDRDSFRLTYPFSPAFVHAMVDISSALQRERTALKLMQQLLVDYRDTLPVGQLMPLGAIFDVLASGADRPFTDKLRDEFERPSAASTPSGSARTCWARARSPRSRFPGCRPRTRSAPTTSSSRRCCSPRWCPTCPPSTG